MLHYIILKTIIMVGKKELCVCEKMLQLCYLLEGFVRSTGKADAKHSCHQGIKDREDGIKLFTYLSMVNLDLI